jgi:hypothetical protein
MPRRQAIPTDTGGTIVWVVPEGGAITSATVKVYDQTGEITTINGDSVTPNGRELRVSISSAIADSDGLYRCRWAYSVDGNAVTRDQKFWVVPAPASSVLTRDRLTRTYWPQLERLDPRGAIGNMDAGSAIAAAWEWLSDVVTDHITAVYAEEGTRDESRGIHAVVDAGEVFERAQASRAAYIMASNATTGSDTTSDWQAWASERSHEAKSEIDRILAARPWMHFDEDDPAPQDGAPRADLVRISL